MVINKVSGFIDKNCNIDEVIKFNDTLEQVINNVHKLTYEIIKSKTDDEKIYREKQICTGKEFRLIQIRKLTILMKKVTQSIHLAIK